MKGKVLRYLWKDLSLVYGGFNPALDDFPEVTEDRDLPFSDPVAGLVD